METSIPAPGTFAISKQGRDTGKLYLIVSAEDGGYVQLCDGDLRKMVNPKRKKIKHLVVLDEVNETIAQKLAAKDKVYDSQIYSAIKRVAETLEIKVSTDREVKFEQSIEYIHSV